MAVAQVSTTHKDTVHTLLKRPQDMMRGHTAGTHHTDRPDVRWILQSTNPSQVSSGVCSPRTQKAYDFGFKINVTHGLSSFN